MTFGGRNERMSRSLNRHPRLTVTVQHDSKA